MCLFFLKELAYKHQLTTLTHRNSTQPGNANKKEKKGLEVNKFVKETNAEKLKRLNIYHKHGNKTINM